MHFIWPVPEWRQLATFHERGNPRSRRQADVGPPSCLFIDTSFDSVHQHAGDRNIRKAASISRTQVGLVTLISVRRSPMISEPTKIRAFGLQRRADAAGDFPVAFGQRASFAAAGGQIAAGLATLRNTRRAVRHGLPSTTNTRLSPSLMAGR